MKLQHRQRDRKHEGVRLSSGGSRPPKARAGFERLEAVRKFAGPKKKRSRRSHPTPGGCSLEWTGLRTAARRLHPRRDPRPSPRPIRERPARRGGRNSRGSKERIPAGQAMNTLPLGGTPPRDGSRRKGELRGRSYARQAARSCQANRVFTYARWRACNAAQTHNWACNTRAESGTAGCRCRIRRPRSSDSIPRR